MDNQVTRDMLSDETLQSVLARLMLLEWYVDWERKLFANPNLTAGMKLTAAVLMQMNCLEDEPE